MNAWHDVDPKRVSPEKFVTCIEISKGTKTKYEIDKETGLLVLDRVLYTSSIYPQNYGFIPLSLGEDGDPLDVLLLSSEPVLPLSLVESRPIGGLNMVDQGKRDTKIIAVAVSDPFYNSYHDLSELPSHVMDEIRHFFTVYKELEGKPTAVEQSFGVLDARNMIEKALKSYQKNVAPKIKAQRKERGY